MYGYFMYNLKLSPLFSHLLLCEVVHSFTIVSQRAPMGRTAYKLVKEGGGHSFKCFQLKSAHVCW